MADQRHKVLVIFGTRPEAIKMAPLVLELQSRPEFECYVCVTGQHREMLDQVLLLFRITPQYDLNVMAPNQDLFDVTGKVLIGLREVLDDCQPAVALVHGDTTTTLAASLACFYRKIPVGHVEAGLRTYDMHKPFPEEANRQLTSRLAAYHFAPTTRAAQNLFAEAVPEAAVTITGNTVIDALLTARDRALALDGAFVSAALGDKAATAVCGSDARMVLITGHRRENFGQRFLELCNAIRRLALERPDVQFVYPVHLNPNVQAPVNQVLSGIANVHLIAPLDYLPFVWLLDRCFLVLTDSGGLQEEAPGFGKPVLVMRDSTERPEAIEAGTAQLVGTDAEKIFSAVSALLDDQALYARMSGSSNPFGDGFAAKRICDHLLKHAPQAHSRAANP